MRPFVVLAFFLALTAVVSAAPEDRVALPGSATMDRLARTDAIAFLENCLKRYDDDVRGYQALLHKQERAEGKLKGSEEIEVSFREKPFSVLLVWRKGARQAQRVLYVKGENDEQLLARPAGELAFRLAGIVSRSPTGPEARQSGRYPITQFGMKLGLERTLASWKAAQKADALHVEYLGRQRIAEAGGRECWVLRRDRFARPEDDGLAQATLFVDTQTWLPVGTILKDKDNRLLGEYFFQDVRINPDFPAGQFTRTALE